MTALGTPLRFYSRAYFERVAAALYGGATGRDPNSRSELLRIRNHAPPPSSYGYAMQLLGANGWSSLPFLNAIPHETLVITGDDDPLVPVKNARILADRIPRARLEIVKRAGHLLLWDDTPNVAARIRSFINARAETDHGSVRTATRKLRRKLTGVRGRDVLPSPAITRRSRLGTAEAGAH
jgi:pimeloyl-ACP methyl ester carboxylesterase